MNASEITKMVEAKMDEFKPRFKRMDEDYDRWDMKGVGNAYDPLLHQRMGMRDTDIEIISNKPRTFCDNVQSILSSSERTIAVRMAETQGGDMRDEMGKLERLLEYVFEKADERLISLLLGTLKENLVWYSIVRGWASARFLVYKDGKNVIFDFLPYDPRWLVYQVGVNGLLWTEYTTYLSPEAIRDEYGKAGQDATSGRWWKLGQKAPDTIPIIDFWKDLGNGKKGNSIVCNKVFLKGEEPYDLDSMPVLIAPVATRPPIRGALQTEMEGYGDSILAPNRRIDDLINKMGSMWASHANLLAKQPLLNYIDGEGKTLNDTILFAGGVYNLPMGHQKIEASPLQEISPTLVNFVNWLNSMQVEGSQPSTTDPSGSSGTRYALEQEASNRVWNPQLRNLNSFYGNACRLVFEQLLAGGVGGDKIKKFKIQGQYKNQYFEDEITPPDLKRAHTINVTFTARTPWQQMDTYQIADMAKRQGIPQRFINEYILKFQDPKYLDDMSAMEMADASPKLAMLKAIEAYMKYGQPEKAQQLMQDMFNMQMQEDAQTQTIEQGAQPEGEPTPPVVEQGEGI